METLKVQAYEKGHVQMETTELPALKENEVLIETHYTAISPGTELAWLHHMANTPGQYPYYPGYSGCGKIVAKGEQVEGLEVGDLVAAQLKHWAYNIFNADSCIKLPDGVSSKNASPFYLASISLQGIRKADIQIGDEVAVLGLGPIGNPAAQLAFVAGAANVVGFDIVEWRRTLAEKCGIKNTDSDGSQEKHQNKYDVVIEATGVPEAIVTAFQMARPLGTVILLGSTRGMTENVNFYSDVHRKGITVVGAHTMHRAKNPEDRFGHFRTEDQDNDAIIKLIHGERITFEPMISGLYTPYEAQSIYDRLLAREDKLMLPVFDWGKD